METADMDNSILGGWPENRQGASPDSVRHLVLHALFNTDEEVQKLSRNVVMGSVAIRFAIAERLHPRHSTLAAPWGKAGASVILWIIATQS